MLMNPFDFPDDDNGDVLHRLQKNGDNLTESRVVDFTGVFSTEESAQEFAEHFLRLGYKVSVRHSNCVQELLWDAVVKKKNMVPSHSGITQFEEELQEISEGLGGRNDGWGCFSQGVPNG
jgi:Regulator of ribonuclease activity B